MKQNFITLLELNNLVRELITTSFTDSYWIIAEILEIKVNNNMHCYLELIERQNEQIVTKSRATIWNSTFRMLKPYFETSTNQRLREGIKVLINVEVVFSELYGFSLNIKDIDPTYTVGEIENNKNKIIARITEEGIIDMNKELDFPLIPQNIAIISSKTAAGYDDFIHQLDNNIGGYKFYHKLFSSSMQGDFTEESIISALESIYKYEDFFDVVVIIRGGGAISDLECFDNYNIASNVAQFPLPILSGIGHQKDISIVDMVAFEHFKTPTAVAQFLIDKMQNVENYLDEVSDFITNRVVEKINDEKEHFYKFANSIYNISFYIQNRQNYLNILQEKLKNSANSLINQEKYNLGKSAIFLEKVNKMFFSVKNSQIENLENNIKLLNPENVLKKGYTITLKNNKLIKNSKKLKKGDEIISIFYDGEKNSIIS